MKRLFIVVLSLFAFPVMASHIVGGEFELIHLTDFQYRLNLIIYFDEVNGIQQNKQQDAIIFARIFRDSDNALMQEVSLPFVSISNVSYTKSECAIGDLATSRMYYTTTLTLSPEIYNDPAGYYVVWERCCRNYNIKNIFSENPQTSPGNGAGQTFFLKFPPVVMNGVPFINSTPRLFPPLSDYACINQPYYANFGGTDNDGDSLAYSIVTPLSTHSQQPSPPAEPKPYPLVTWRFPYGLNNVLNGAPDLDISNEGLLTVTPRSDVGLFVFAVKCEEFRNGVKIGELRRDFQMLVQDCKEAVKPRIEARYLNSSTYSSGNMTVLFTNQVSDEDRCVVVKVSDDDAFRATDGSQERVGIRVIPIGFKRDLSDILPDVQSAVLTPQSPSKEFKICFDRCPLKEGILKLGIISFDDACALPLADTVILSVSIQPPANSNPYFTTPDVVATVMEPDRKIWQIRALDNDLDTLDVSVVTDGFNFGEKGFFLENIQHLQGQYSADLRWEANCSQYDFTDRTDFPMSVIVDDRDPCDANDSVTVTLDLHVALPHSDPPEISTDIPAQHDNKLVARVFESINFLVTGTDGDNNPLTLEVEPDGFDLADHGINFDSVTGNSPVKSPFNWNILCTNLNLAEKDTFNFRFRVRDSKDRCGIFRTDSTDVQIRLLPALNNAPTLIVDNLSPELQLVDNKVELFIGQELKLQLRADDGDVSPKDSLKIDLVKAVGNVEPSGYEFSPARGVGSVQSIFTWAPDCSIFENGVYTNEYFFTFSGSDDRCMDIKGDTLEVMITIKDVDGAATEFLPPNFITPNSDGCNDFFGLEDLDGSFCGNMHIPNLPKDNCVGHFISIAIYNRWGKEVFKSGQRDFRWLPEDEAAGVYYYTLQYSNAEYKGSITVLF
jgi:hypothetical protein